MPCPPPPLATCAPNQIRDGAYLDGAVSKESQAQSLRLMAGLMEDMKTWYRYASNKPVAGGDYQPLLTNVGRV